MGILDLEDSLPKAQYTRPLRVNAHLGWRYLHIGDRSSQTVLDRQD